MTYGPANPAATRLLPRCVLLAVVVGSPLGVAAEGRHQAVDAALESARSRLALEAGGSRSVSVSGHGGLHAHRRSRQEEAARDSAAVAATAANGSRGTLSSLLEEANGTLTWLLEEGKSDATAAVSNVAEAIDALVNSADGSVDAEAALDGRQRPRAAGRPPRRHQRPAREGGGSEGRTRSAAVEALKADRQAFSVASLAERRVTAEALARLGAGALAPVAGDPAALLAGLDDETPIIVDMSPLRGPNPEAEPPLVGTGAEYGDYYEEDTPVEETETPGVEHAQNAADQDRWHIRAAHACGIDKQTWEFIVMVLTVITFIWGSFVVCCYYMWWRRDRDAPALGDDGAG
eukprot:TRINITY_DN38179_c0_g1_i1.p1 TRINITY_DN38179_c0_g1~~TRINITY_DN38179_c0_g1_i1.p1  ORF type:complete len:348 (-),score=86.50 TRINITY_DN38179_c0_g1_i1:18-1061(-)